MKYFVAPFTDDSLKVQYKTWCKIVHPDVKGGSKEQFQEMKAEYEYCLQHHKAPPGKEHWTDQRQHGSRQQEKEFFFAFSAFAENIFRMSGIFDRDYKSVYITQQFNMVKGEVEVKMYADGKEVTNVNEIRKFIKKNPIKL